MRRAGRPPSPVRNATAAASVLLMATAALAGEAPAFRVFPRSPLDLVPPDAPPAEVEPDAAVLKLAAAPGEFEPAVFTVRALKAIKGLRVAASELKGPKGSAIPASSARIQRVLTGRFQVGPKEKRREIVVPEWLVPADEAASDLAQDRNETFWIVFRVPDDAPAGRFAGTVSVLAEGCAPCEIAVELAVRPFRLAPPTAAFAMLYTYEFRYLERYDSEYEPAEKRRPPADRAAFVERGRAVVRDMAEHGMTAIFPHSSRVLLRKDGKLSMPDLEMSLKTAREFGMTAAPGWVVSHLVNAQWADIPKYDAKRDGAFLREIAAGAAEVAKAQGFAGIALVPSDEPTIEKKLVVARELLAAAKGAAEGVRLAVTANAETFRTLADLHQISIFAGGTPDEWAESRKAGRDVWIYENNSACGHNPSWSRFVFGFYGWRSGFDGISSWTYPLNIGDYAGRKRADADGKPVPEYDAKGRPINTLVWEGIREGTDDRRYIDTLSAAIAAARKQGKAADADEADKLLADLKASIPPALSDYGFVHTEYGDPAPGKFDAAWFAATREKIAEAIGKLLRDREK